MSDDLGIQGGCTTTCTVDKNTVALTSRGHEDLDGRLLQQVAPEEDGPDLVEVPFPMQMVHVRQHL